MTNSEGIAGYVDVIEYTSKGVFISGWASGRVVHIRDSTGLVLGEGRAENLRLDVAEAGYSRPHCGYRIRLESCGVPPNQVFAFSETSPIYLLPGPVDIDPVKFTVSESMKEGNFRRISELILSNYDKTIQSISDILSQEGGFDNLSNSFLCAPGMARSAIDWRGLIGVVAGR